MAGTGNRNGITSAIALFVFLAVALLFLPCLTIILLRSRRSRKHRARLSAQNQESECWATGDPLASVPIPQPTAQPFSVRRDSRGNKILPRIYRNQAGIFDRATVALDDNRHCPRSPPDEAKRELEIREHIAQEQSLRSLKPESSGLPYPNQLEGRHLTPNVPLQKLESASFSLQPVPEKALRTRLGHECTTVQKVAQGKGGLSSPPRVCSTMVHIDNASFDTVDLAENPVPTVPAQPQGPPGWI